MMSCTTSVAWSHSVSSPCYTEHGQRCGAVLSGCITTIAMFRSGQMGMRCTVESNCSDLSATVLWTHASLAACLRQLDLFLFLWSTARWGS
jgi:hypothetical protein